MKESLPASEPLEQHERYEVKLEPRYFLLQGRLRSDFAALLQPASDPRQATQLEEERLDEAREELLYDEYSEVTGFTPGTHETGLASEQIDGAWAVRRARELLGTQAYLSPPRVNREALARLWLIEAKELVRRGEAAAFRTLHGDDRGTIGEQVYQSVEDDRQRFVDEGFRPAAIRQLVRIDTTLETLAGGQPCHIKPAVVIRQTPFLGASERAVLDEKLQQHYYRLRKKPEEVTPFLEHIESIRSRDDLFSLDEEFGDPHSLYDDELDEESFMPEEIAREWRNEETFRRRHFLKALTFIRARTPAHGTKNLAREYRFLAGIHHHEEIDRAYTEAILDERHSETDLLEAFQIAQLIEALRSAEHYQNEVERALRTIAIVTLLTQHVPHEQLHLILPGSAAGNLHWLSEQHHSMELIEPDPDVRRSTASREKRERIRRLDPGSATDIAWSKEQLEQTFGIPAAEYTQLATDFVRFRKTLFEGSIERDPQLGDPKLAFTLIEAFGNAAQDLQAVAGVGEVVDQYRAERPEFLPILSFMVHARLFLMGKIAEYKHFASAEIEGGLYTFRQVERLISVPAGIGRMQRSIPIQLLPELWAHSFEEDGSDFQQNDRPGAYKIAIWYQFEPWKDLSSIVRKMCDGDTRPSDILRAQFVVDAAPALLLNRVSYQVPIHKADELIAGESPQSCVRDTWVTDHVLVLSLIEMLVSSARAQGLEAGITKYSPTPDGPAPIKGKSKGSGGTVRLAKFVLWIKTKDGLLHMKEYQVFTPAHGLTGSEYWKQFEEDHPRYSLERGEELRRALTPGILTDEPEVTQSISTSGTES